MSPRRCRPVVAVACLLLLMAAPWMPSLGLAPLAHAQDEHEATEQSVAPGTLEVRSTPPGAAVIVNGRRLGATPLTLVMPSDLRLNVQVELAGYQSQEQTVTITSGQTQSVALSLEPLEAQPE